jgi:hypothetical protein
VDLAGRELGAAAHDLQVHRVDVARKLIVRRAANHAVAWDTGPQCQVAGDWPVVFTTTVSFGVVVRCAPEVRAHHDVYLVGQALSFDLIEHATEASQQLNQVSALVLIVVSVGIEATDADVGCDGQARLECRQGQLRRTDHVLCAVEVTRQIDQFGNAKCR